MRQRKQTPPPGCATRIRELAADGWSKKGIAHHLNTSQPTLNRWMKENADFQTAFDEGREQEHKALFNALFRLATEKGNAVAAMFLLKARHGYREGDQTEIGNRVSINFNLPGAQPLEAFIASTAKPVEQRVIAHD